MGSIFCVSMSSAELDHFEAPEPEVEPEGDVDDEALVELARLRKEQFKRHLDRLPPIEADAIELVMRGCTQRNIAVVLAPAGEPPYTQPAVSALIQKGLERVGYLVWLDALGLDETIVRDVADRLACTPLQADVAAAVWLSQSFYGAADLLGTLNGLQVRQRFMIFADRVMACDSPEVGMIKFWLRGFRSGQLREHRKNCGPRKHLLAGPRDIHG